jgi:hypothetical protein
MPPKPPMKSTAVVTIPAPNLRNLRVLVVGDSKLICHRFGEKARKQMEDKQQRKARVARAERNPEEEYHASLYSLEGKRGGPYGFPAAAFKHASLFACSHVEGVTKVQVKGAFHVLGDLVALIEPLTGKPAQPRTQTDPVRIGMGTSSLAYRGVFDTWGAWLSIRYNANVMTAEQIVNLLNTAGFCSGIGEWRPSSPKRPGGHGMFHVKEAKES